MIKPVIEKAVREAIAQLDWPVPEIIAVEKPLPVRQAGKSNFGDYAVNVAFGLAKTLKKSPAEIADELTGKIQKPEEIARVEAVGGYINFFLTPEYLQKELEKIANAENYGHGEGLKDKTVMVEYTDPNPFKLFHIGHLMSNAIGEAIARLYETQGARVIRANYQGDVGLHVAKAVWGMHSQLPPASASLTEKIKFLGEAYARGAAAYEHQPESKKAITEVNQKVYDRSDTNVNQLYDTGRQWSLEYFETIYARLGTKFDQYFFESAAAQDGLAIVQQNKSVFTESDGAIVFRGEEYGLHTRVFVNAKGLPTYEAKELGLNKKKFELYPLALSIIITGNEIVEYFKVLLKVMSLIIPEAAAKTYHVAHGMLRLPTGKMSSRTGAVITVEELIEQTEGRLKTLRGESSEPIALAAIKYSILKQSPGRDIIFDFDKSLSVHGDAGPYLQYTYARLSSILAKTKDKNQKAKLEELTEKSELDLIKQLLDFPEILATSTQRIAPNHLALYLYELANLANTFYEKVPVRGDENSGRLAARLILVSATARTLKTGLAILGIQALERI